MDLHPATRGFDAAGERYERGRPEYPPAAVDWLVAQLGLAARPGARVLDIGAGTGKLTRPLLERGLRVIAVEPVAGMRATLERTAPLADVRAAQAEALPLEAAAVDGIVAAQAFHWFANAAALREFARVLHPDGRLGLVWNRRDLDQPLQAAIDRLVRAVPCRRAGARERRLAGGVHVRRAVRARDRAPGCTRPGVRHRWARRPRPVDQLHRGTPRRRAPHDRGARARAGRGHSARVALRH